MYTKSLIIDSRSRNIVCKISDQVLNFSDVLDIVNILDKYNINSCIFYDGSGSYTGIRLSWCLAATLNAIYGYPIYHTFNGIDIFKCDGPSYE